MVDLQKEPVQSTQQANSKDNCDIPRINRRTILTETDDGITSRNPATTNDDNQISSTENADISSVIVPDERATSGEPQKLNDDSSGPPRNPQSRLYEQNTTGAENATPARQIDELLTNRYERLSYRIYLLGIPAGEAELDARRVNEGIKIVLKVSSGPAVSAIYPVNNLIETTHIGGNFILSKVRRQEGLFRSDLGFTIFMHEKRVFWINRLTNRSTMESLPNSDVLDLLSGLYYLRKQQLEVGHTEMLHIYDSDAYAQVPVEILRHDQVELPGRGEIDTLVIRPRLKTDGLFKSTGDVFIWLSNDEFKVPVKVEASIPIGNVTAKLVGSEVLNTNVEQ